MLFIYSKCGDCVDTTIYWAEPLSYIINWREGSNMASEKKVKPKTWRILAKNDARSTPFGPVLSWYLPLTRLNSEPTSEFHTPLVFFVKNLKVFLFFQCFCCHIRINMARSFIYFRSLTISGTFYSAMGELKRSRVREMFKNNFWIKMNFSRLVEVENRDNETDLEAILNWDVLI